MATKNTYSTVKLKGKLDRTFDTAYAGGVLKPGYVCKLHTDNTIIVHATASGPAADMVIATEDDLQGKTVDQAYAALDEVPYQIPIAGDEYAMWLTTSQTVAIGDNLVSNGDGLLKEADGTDEHLLFRAMEAVTTTGAAKQIRCRYLGNVYLKA